MRIYKTKWFSRWARKHHVDDAALLTAIAEMHEGLVDADLGGRVYKKRVARASQGKRGGLRTLVAFHVDDRAFFVYGFAKNAQDNVGAGEVAAPGRVNNCHGVALLPKIVPAKARGAGPSRSRAKPRNAAWRDFGRNPSGRGHFSAILRCRSLE